MRNQKGAALLIGLMLLLVLTILAVTAVNMSTVNLRIVNNMQSKQVGQDDIQQAVEAVIQDTSKFSPGNTATALPPQTFPDGGAVTIGPRVCVADAQDGLTSKNVMTSHITTWEIDATYAAPSGTKEHIVQGVQIELPEGYCI